MLFLRTQSYSTVIHVIQVLQYCIYQNETVLNPYKLETRPRSLIDVDIHLSQEIFWAFFIIQTQFLGAKNRVKL